MANEFMALKLEGQEPDYKHEYRKLQAKLIHQKNMQEEYMKEFAEWVSSNGWTYVPVYKAWRYLQSDKKYKTTNELMSDYNIYKHKL